MKGLKKLNAECNNESFYRIIATFYNEEDERSFLHDVAEALHEEFVVSTLIHDLDVCIELYKDYFSSSDYSIIEDDPTHPFISCSVLDSQGKKSVIDNFGYYTLDAYLYWTKDGMDFKSISLNEKDYFFINHSILTIRQVLDLSLEIQVSDKVISALWDILKKQLIPH